MRHITNVLTRGPLPSSLFPSGTITRPGPDPMAKRNDTVPYVHDGQEFSIAQMDGFALLNRGIS